jgi:hypothetical protein
MEANYSIRLTPPLIRWVAICIMFVVFGRSAPANEFKRSSGRAGQLEADVGLPFGATVASFKTASAEGIVILDSVRIQCRDWTVEVTAAALKECAGVITSSFRIGFEAGDESSEPSMAFEFLFGARDNELVDLQHLSTARIYVTATGQSELLIISASGTVTTRALPVTMTKRSK